MTVFRHGVAVADEKYHGLNPIGFGYGSCSNGYFYGPVARKHWVIHYVVSGFGCYKLNGRQYQLGPGEMFVIPPNEITCYQADEHDPWSYIWIEFTADSPLPAKLDDTIHCPEALSVFNHMKNCEKIENGRSAFLSARLWDLFAIILANTSYHPDFIQNALDCIHSEYMNKITVDSLAKRLNLNRSYFSAAFKKRIGVPPMKYLLNYRMSTAASMMTQKNVSVSAAAHSVGYTDVFNFSKMFKRHYGMSPSEYVKMKKRTSELTNDT